MPPATAVWRPADGGGRIRATGPQVWVVSDGKAKPRPVKVGEFREQTARITEGLQAGEMVIVTGASKLVDGQAVDTQNAPAGRQR
jgi:multidrug efflux system membrane fusion protein